MVKFHGTPLTPKNVFVDALSGRNCLIPFPRPDNAELAFANCDKIILDNGAFSVWRQGIKINWDDYYQWVEMHQHREFYFIPDIIDGSEEENDALLADNPFSDGVPIWHVSETLNRLERLCADYELIAFGSSGEYAQLGTTKWHDKMDEAMHIVCDSDGFPKRKIHMLRCLNPKIFTRYPFYSGDSTNLARNHSRDGWKNILWRIEKYDSPNKYIFRKKYITNDLFDGEHMLSRTKEELKQC